MPQRSVASTYTFEQQRTEINLLAADFWSHKTTVDGASSTYLKHDGSNDFTGATLLRECGVPFHMYKELIYYSNSSCRFRIRFSSLSSRCSFYSPHQQPTTN